MSERIAHAFRFVSSGGLRVRGSRETFHVGAEGDLRQYLAKREERWRAAVQNEREAYLLQVNETDYINHLVSTYRVDIPRLDYSRWWMDHEEREVSTANMSPALFADTPPRTIRTDVYTVHIPYTGDGGLLRYQGSAFGFLTQEVFLQDQHVCFDTQGRGQPGETIRAQVEGIRNTISRYAGVLERDLTDYNAKLAEAIGQAVRRRKQQLLAKNETLAAIGIPIRKREDVPATFAVPAARQPRRIVFPKPELHESGYTPEPTLDPAIYREILTILYDAGKNFERFPSTYERKGEEALRDQLLFLLQPHFRLEGSATGETFNKIGKTDILIRWQSHNVFVAECKFWGGEKRYLETISQLLGYLTWRDSKAAVIIFDRNKEVSASLNAIEASTRRHPNHLGFVGRNEEGWFSYRFHLDGDRNREVHLAILVFHIPPLAKS